MFWMIWTGPQGIQRLAETVRRDSGFVDSLQTFFDRIVLNLLFRNRPETFNLADLMGKSSEAFVAPAQKVDLGFKGRLPESESKFPPDIMRPVFEVNRIFLSKSASDKDRRIEKCRLHRASRHRHQVHLHSSSSLHRSARDFVG